MHTLKKNKQKTFSKLLSKFVFISSTQTGLNRDRRNNVPTCCVKLYELMKSADELVRDLKERSSPPLVLYADSQRCFPKLDLTYLQAFFNVSSKYAITITNSLTVLSGCVCVVCACMRAHMCMRVHTPIQKRHPEMPPSSLFTFCILSAALIQKPEPCE